MAEPPLSYCESEIEVIKNHQQQLAHIEQLGIGERQQVEKAEQQLPEAEMQQKPASAELWQQGEKEAAIQEILQ